MEIKKKKAHLAGLKSCSVSAGNTKRYGFEKLLYTGHKLGAGGPSLAMGMWFSGPQCCCQFVLYSHVLLGYKKIKKSMNKI